jgi:predicted RNA-binding protein with PUA-like domain
MKYWLFKSEPDVFGIEHLKGLPNQTDHWDGIRNYQARNLLRDDIKQGDKVFFYHSNCKEPAIVGIMQVTRNGYPDHTAFDPEAHYYDPKSDPDNPRWYMVDVKYLRDFKRQVTLSELKKAPQLDGMTLLRRGNRLSVMPVSKDHWDFILQLEKQPGKKT